MHQASNPLRQLLRPVVEAMGYELVGVEYHPRAGGALLRVYIDQEAGINVADCEQVSHQIGGVLDVEDPIPGHYTLEVSSPGLDRPLFEAAHFARFAGREARIELIAPQHGRRRFRGRLRGVTGDEVIIEVEGELLSVPLAQVEKARLVPDL